MSTHAHIVVDSVAWTRPAPRKDTVAWLLSGDILERVPRRPGSTAADLRVYFSSYRLRLVEGTQIVPLVSAQTASGLTGEQVSAARRPDLMQELAAALDSRLRRSEIRRRAVYFSR